MPESLADWLAYAETLHPRNIDLGLVRVATVRDALGLAPAFPCITVGGTNGKGSACALLEAILGAAGYRVGVYTSPHLVRYNERVRIAGADADDAALVESFAAVEAARGAVPLTYFEFGTLAAVWLLQRRGVNAGVLEVGLGGRLDAVNVFEPDCALVMSVDIDHRDYLGDSRETIGFEKAGIYRARRPAVCADPDPPRSLVDHARSLGADLRRAGVDFHWARQGKGWAFAGRAWRLESLPGPALAGEFQFANAAGVLAALESVQGRLAVTPQAIAQGLSAVRLRGRFEVIGTHPEIILDVAHNPHAARALAAMLRARPGSGRTVAVFGVLADKDIRGIVDAVRDLVDAWFIAALATPRAASHAAVRDAIGAASGAVTEAAGVAEALSGARREAGPNDRIIVFGSFYTVGAALLQQTAHGGAPDR